MLKGVWLFEAISHWNAQVVSKQLFQTLRYKPLIYRMPLLLLSLENIFDEANGKHWSDNTMIYFATKKIDMHKIKYTEKRKIQ